MRIAFNKKVVDGPWGGGNQMLMILQGYLTRRNHEVVASLDDCPNVIVIMDSKEASCSFSMSDVAKYKKSHECKIVHRVNDNGSHRKGNNDRNDDLMIDVNRKLADETIFISGWLKNYYEERGLNVEGSHVIVNGTDRGRFFPTDSIRRRPQEPIRIITHHWSSNPSKGYHVYEDISRFCYDNPRIANFTFMGNKPEGFLDKANVIDPKPYFEIPSYLCKHDVYITATQFESGGCHIVEGMACGLIPMVRIGGGGVEEYAKGYSFSYGESEEVITHIRELYENYFEFEKSINKVRKEYTYGAMEMCDAYRDVFTGGR